MKLLSIIIPTYNMAALLPRCLDSLVSAQRAEALDILVVNDGSKDSSLQVAQQYAYKYPSIIHVIDKPNGNYGSTINAALPVAKGKYVKVLDSDDWFDTAVLDAFLAAIEPLDADMLVTHFTQIGAKEREVYRYNTMGREPYDYGKIYDFDTVLNDGYIRFFLMHALTYRTELLQSIGYRQTEGVSYTDTEWSCYPTFYANTICFLDLNLYQYNLDREGQTMAPEVLMKSVRQLQTVTDAMLDYYESHVADLSPVRRKWMEQYYINRLRILYKIYLLDMPRADFNAADLGAMDAKYAPICERNGWTVRLYPENKILRTEYIRYWHKHHRRWPRWYERLNHCVDIMVKWLYIRLFRR
ncbi:MAG: glycosyltransferase family 2 protein [Paludibacteraceae bacterium]|nr:glycosyltransferase family 2 protein [Paludibacteraceae bacterium]